MENVAQIIGIVLIIVGVVDVARVALSGAISLNALAIPIILIVIGAFLMNSNF